MQKHMEMFSSITHHLCFSQQLEAWAQHPSGLTVPSGLHKETHRAAPASIQALNPWPHGDQANAIICGVLCSFPVTLHGST